MEYTLRPARDDDFEFLYRLRSAALGPYVAQIWGWNEDEQRQRFAHHFDSAQYRIVRREKDIGAIAVEEREHEIYLSNIELLPEYQRKGIGTALMGAVLAEAGRKNLPVSLQVFKINPARHLYERLGFQITGETETHYQMCRPVHEHGC
jgi:ribosomal protein S18 acetylase RimI-like enzyme